MKIINLDDFCFVSFLLALVVYLQLHICLHFFELNVLVQWGHVGKVLFLELFCNFLLWTFFCIVWNVFDSRIWRRFLSRVSMSILLLYESFDSYQNLQVSFCRFFGASINLYFFFICDRTDILSSLQMIDVLAHASFSYVFWSFCKQNTFYKLYNTFCLTFTHF